MSISVILVCVIIIYKYNLKQCVNEVLSNILHGWYWIELWVFGMCKGVDQNANFENILKGLTILIHICAVHLIFFK